MRMCVSTCIRTSLLFHIHTNLSPYLYVYMFRLFCNDPLYPIYSIYNTSLCTCSQRLAPMLTKLLLHIQGSVFQYSFMSRVYASYEYTHSLCRSKMFNYVSTYPSRMCVLQSCLYRYLFQSPENVLT